MRYILLLFFLLLFQNESKATTLYLKCEEYQFRRMTSELDLNPGEWKKSRRGPSDFEVTLIENNMIGSIFYTTNTGRMHRLDSVSFSPNFIFFTKERTYSFTDRSSKWEFLINRSDGTYLRKSDLYDGTYFESKGKCSKTKAKGIIF